MTQHVTKQQAIRCSLGVTDNARRGISKFAQDEYAFFAMQPAFDVHIEKRPLNKQGNLSFSIFFDNESNAVLAAQLDGKVAVMECVYKNDGFLATGFHVRGRREPVRTNRRLPVRLKFQLDRSVSNPLPLELYTSLRELPVAEERSEYVKKRIASWEGYLRIQERNADVEDVIATFSKAFFNEDFSKLQLVCDGLKSNDWKTITGCSAKMKGQQQDIGNVVQVQKSQRIVEIELNRHYQDLARRQEWHPKSYKELTFSNFAELSQVKRLRKGFKDLQDGLAANPNLEKILFEERPVVRISKEQKELEFHNPLNEFQREAVTGAMTAHDLYVIQGPPGTGKTTVISEICHQNVKAGLRTLVASQANLAVDNALGRLLSHQDIRILRYGRTESIEEEGKKFIEENVATQWRDQTLQAVQEHLQLNANRKEQLEQEIDLCEQQLKQIQQDLLAAEEQIGQKQVAESEHLALSKELVQLSERIENVEQQIESLTKAQETLHSSVESKANEINRTEQFLQTNRLSSEKEEQIKAWKQQIEKLQSEIGYYETKEQIGEKIQSLEFLQIKRTDLENERERFLTLLEEIRDIAKLEDLKKCLSDFGWTPPETIEQKITELTRAIDALQASASTSAYKEWTELRERLTKALAMIRNILESQGFMKQALQSRIPANRRYTALQDIHGLVDNIGRYIMKPNVKQVLASRNYHPDKFEFLEIIATAYVLLVDRQKFTSTQLAVFDQTKELFEDVKRDVDEQAKLSISRREQEMAALLNESKTVEQQLQKLREVNSKQLEMVGDIDETVPLTDVKERLNELETTVAAHEKAMESVHQGALELQKQQEEHEELLHQITSNAAAIQSNKQQIEKLKIELAGGQEKATELEKILQLTPELDRQRLLDEKETVSQKVEEIKKEQIRLPVTNALQQEWLTLLTEANDYDLDEIRKLYVRHANVIGTTCVASARRDFMEEYPTFDVVIIDEVSKATPPELLLPMLKGKKIILVGDHHQLPPLVGQETMDEFLEEIEEQDEKRELEKLLKESLFERLFRTLPKQNKTMLGIQYRMHESIMETISPFYKEGDSRLRCGLEDSDAIRDHLLESRFVQRKDHLLWFDMPHRPDYFEEKVKGGTSLYNEAELKVIRELLEDLDGAAEQAKQQGRMQADVRKSVGVISFYGEQVKRIDRLIQQELLPQHLHCRTGSVDKFQGMEMDVIVLSFVRNHDEKSGSIGFAKDYRRLNVALSRARELLIIVGSSEMFTIRTKDANSRQMYGRLLDEIKKKNGLRQVDEMIVT